MRAWQHVLTNITTDRADDMSHIDSLFNRVMEVKEMEHQKIVNRINRRKEDVPPLFWIAMFALAMLVMVPDAHADTNQSRVTVACVAINVFHEAAHEPDLGKFAVAFVTLNRMKASNEDACTVVFKSKQFSWANHAIDSTGKLKPEYMPKGAKWAEAKKIAVMALNGDVEDFTQGADHYHADYISKPQWARKMEYVGKWGAHLFYRGAM